jgi:hypothetical protein
LDEKPIGIDVKRSGLLTGSWLTPARSIGRPSGKQSGSTSLAKIGQCLEDVAESDRRATILVKRLGRNQEDAVADRGTRGAGAIA